jgi:hypothetical protein
MKKTILLVPLLFAVVANATPTTYPTDLNLFTTIQNPTDSNLVSDDTDSHRIYVMPPNDAEAHVTGLHTLTANLGFCKEMSDLQGYSRTTSKRIAELVVEDDANKVEVEKVRKTLAAARTDAAKFATERNLAALTDLDQKIQEMEARLSDLYKTNETCTKNCETIQAEAANLEKLKYQVLKDRRALATQHADDARTYDQKKAKIQALQLNYDEAQDRFVALQTRLMKVRNQFLEMYTSFGKMEGGRAGFNYVSHWDENLEKLKASNPGYDFQKIQTQDAKLFSGIKIIPDLPGASAILAYEIPGNQKEGYIELPSGFPGSISANVVLSLVGACPMLHPGDFNIDPKYKSDDMTYGLAVTYTFPSAFRIKATAKYNMHKMYTKIMSSGSSGGFFSSRSWSNVEERTFFKDSFSVDWKIDDPENSVTEEQRLAVEHDMRVHIVERLASLAIPTAPNRDQIIAAGAAPAHGSVVVANSLMTACPGNLYCVGGALILQSLDAIFGSSSTSASYTQIQDMDLTESWSRSQVINKPWITSYLPVANTK